jgi:hypothetical protein
MRKERDVIYRQSLVNWERSLGQKHIKTGSTKILNTCHITDILIFYPVSIQIVSYPAQLVEDTRVVLKHKEGKKTDYTYINANYIHVSG